MKRLLLSLFVVLLTNTLFAEDFLQIVSLENTAGGNATFVSAGVAPKRGDVSVNAVKSLFKTLFYQGVVGVEDGKPLVNQDNRLYTNSFFNSTGRYSFYIVSVSEETKPSRTDGQYRGSYRVTIRLRQLVNDLVTNKVRIPQATIDDIDETEGMTKPTIIVVPYTRPEESYASVLENDFDRRVAVSKVQNGFESRDITTVDLQAKLAAVKRRMAYEENAQVAESNDKQLLMTSGADVYVTVDLQKDINEQGARVSLILKAYETASGNVLATKDGWTNRFNTTATDVLCGYAVEDELPAFLNDICKNFSKRITQGSRVVLQIAIAGTSVSTMNDPVGPNNYSLSNVIRQWVRKNAHQGKYHLQGVVDESMIFDYIMIPPRDQDGLLMDAAQFAFLLEVYLKEEIGVDCTSRVDGNNILFTIQ